MSKIGKKIPCRSCLMEAILVTERLLDSKCLMKWDLSKVSKTLATAEVRAIGR